MNINPMQAYVNEMSKVWQSERSQTQMTLGQLIAKLESLPQDALIWGFGEPISYRGYYCDLAFTPSHKSCLVSELLATTKGCMGKIFEGYKGGDYMMGENTPLWMSNYGTASQKKLMDLRDDGYAFVPVTEFEEF